MSSKNRNFPEARLAELAVEAGAVRWGRAPLEPVAEEEFSYFQQWLSDGKHGSMSYLANHLEIRRNPALLLADSAPDGGTVISFAFPYLSGNPYKKGRLRFARYALGDDYHETLRARLRPIAAAISAATGCEARICVDTAPILERYWAVRTGLGQIGRNHQLQIPGIGSHIFLTEIVTSALIIPSIATADISPLPKSSFHLPPACSNCNRCLVACPHGSLSDSFDSRRCLSYLTIEHRGEFPQWVVTLPPRRVYGCDICLEACPASQQGTKISPLPEFLPREELLNLTTEDLQNITPGRFSLMFRHSPVKRVKFSGLLRNIKICP